MDRPSCGTTIFIVGQEEESWDEEVYQARAAGAEHLEIYLEYPSGNGELRERQIRRLRNLTKGARLLVRAPTSWPSLITPHEQLYRLSLEELRNTLLVAAKLGAALFIFHGGSSPFPGLRRTRDAGTRFRESLRELLPLAREPELDLAVENRASGYPTAAEELEEALGAGLKLNLATDEVRGSGQALPDLLKRFSERLAGVTLSPQVEPEPLVAHLREVGFGGFLTLDSPPQPGRWPEIQESLLRLRAAWEGA